MHIALMIQESILFHADLAKWCERVAGIAAFRPFRDRPPYRTAPSGRQFFRVQSTIRRVPSALRLAARRALGKRRLGKDMRSWPTGSTRRNGIRGCSTSYAEKHSPRTAVGQACRGMASSLPRKPSGMKQRALPSGPAAIVEDR